MDKTELTHLIAAASRKDEAAFRQLVEHYQSSVYALSFRLLCDEDDAKDATQETFIRLWLNLEKYDVDYSFLTWLYTIATRLCLDKIRSEKRFRKESADDTLLTHFVSSENADQEVTNAELAAIISTFTAELTPKQRVVFTLRCLEELELDEVARISGQTLAQIKSNLFLARKTIREKLKKYLK